MLSLNNVKQLKDVLQGTLVLCDEMLRHRETEKMFNNFNEYEIDDKVSKRIVPHDFYNFRLFDKKITLFYHIKQKRYYLQLDMPNYFTKFTTNSLYYEIQDKLKLKVIGNNINIPQEYSFEDVEYIFTQFCVLLIHLQFKDYGLQSSLSSS